jgi:hypothetical protein
LRRTGLTNTMCCLPSCYLLLILSIMFYVGTMLKYHIPHLLPARWNFTNPRGTTLSNLEFSDEVKKV